jgi:transcriptional regulator GlxA family with amidase domain
VLGVRLRPGAAGVILGLPASELIDRDTPLRDLWGAGADALAERVGEPPGIAAKLAALEAALAARLAATPPPDPTVAAAVRWLARHPAGRVADLARFLDIGERRLHRRFAAAVGYGSKTFHRVLRLQRALALAGRGPRREMSLAALAAAAGFADQAHMSRELQALTGRSPGALLRQAGSTLELSDLFKTSVEAMA